MGMQDVQAHVEASLGERVTFMRYGANWLFEAEDTVAKVSLDDHLEYAAKTAGYLTSLGFRALAPSTITESGEYNIHVFPKGEAATTQDIVPWIGAILKQLHSLPPPDHLLSYREVTEKQLSQRAGNHRFSPAVMAKIVESYEAAFSLPATHLNHGDPHIAPTTNAIKLGQDLMLIDWDDAVVGPKELDLSVVKYAEWFGEPAETFARIASDYGEYDEERLGILCLARVATSLLWFAHNLEMGYFSDNGELPRRIAGFMGEDEVIFKTDYTIKG